MSTLHRPLNPQGRPQEYKIWNPDHPRRAYEAVTKGKLSVCRAAEQYGVPRSTLLDQVSGKVQLGAHSGPPRYLTDQEESELISFLINCAKAGYARTRLQVLALVQRVVREKGMDVCVTNRWWESFKCRHP